MKHKRLISFALATVTAISLTGCNNGTGSSSDASDSNSDTSSVTDTADTSSVTDTADTTVSETGWEFGQVAMGGGGFVSGVFATKEEGLYYARTDVGGAYRFNKDTGRWESISYGINEDDRGYLGIAALAFAENEPNKVFLLAGTSYFGGGKTALFISDDYGSTYTRTELTELIKVDGNGMGRGNGERLAVDPKNSNIIYAGGMSTGGLIKSTDGGLTFTGLDLGTKTVTSNANGICSILIDPQSGDENGCTTIYAALSRKKDYNLYKSTDGGATWAPVEEAPKGAMIQRMKYNGDGKIVITYADAEGPWNSSRGAGGIKVLDIATDTMTDISPAKEGFGDVVIDPENPDRMVACSENVYVPQPNGAWGDEFYVTTDGGKNWKLLNNDMKLTDGGVVWLSTTSMHWCSSMCIDPNNTDKVMVVSGNGIFACDNIWDDSPEFYFGAKGIEETVPYELVSIPGGELVTAVADYDGFVQDSAEEYGNVHNTTAGSMTGIAVAAENTDVWVKCGGDKNNNGFWYTEDRGATWTKVENSPIGDLKAYGGSVAVSADGKTFYWTPSNGAFAFWSDDKGATWNQSEGGLNAKRITADPVNPEYVYAASSSAFYYSSDRGKTFTANNDLTIFSDARPIVVPGVEGKIYFPAMGLQVSEDHGKTFTRVEGVSNCQMVGLGRGKNDGDPCAIYIWGQPTKDDPLGLYWSADEGKTWDRITDENHLFGGTGNGAFVYGDFNVYGRVYMSTLGLGVVYGDLIEK